MKKLRVSGFPPIVSKDEIIRVFGQYGTIKEVKKAFGAGIAYVYMTYDYQASKAVKELNGTKILGREIKVVELDS